MDLVALVVFANAIRPRHQVENVGGGFKVKQKQRLLARNGAAIQYPLPQFGNSAMVCHVNLLFSHG